MHGNVFLKTVLGTFDAKFACNYVPDIDVFYYERMQAKGLCIMNFIIGTVDDFFLSEILIIRNAEIINPENKTEIKKNTSEEGQR